MMRRALDAGDVAADANRAAMSPLSHSLARRPMGVLEWVVESRFGDRHETWYVLVPDRTLADHCRAMGVDVTPGCRVVVDALSLRPVGVLERAGGASPPAACGYNPYWDLAPC